MIKTEVVSDPTRSVPFECELAPHVWLRQNEREGQFVEIVLPPFELGDLIQECITDFPRYTIALCQAIAERNRQSIIPEGRLGPELMQRILNTQIVGTMLARHPVPPEEKMAALPELKQAFGLAMHGRLRLTAAPLDLSESKCHDAEYEYSADESQR